MQKEWPSVKHLQNGDIAAYFEICVSEGDPALIVAVLGDIARAYGIHKVAKDTGLSEEKLWRDLSAKGNPKFSTVAKVVKAVGLSLSVGNAGLQRVSAPIANISDAINKSGRLWMLPQRLAKCYLQIGQLVDTTRSKKTFNLSLVLFDRQLVELGAFEPIKDNEAALVNLEMAWIEYKDVLVGKAPNKKDAKLILRMSENVSAMAEELTDQLVKLSGGKAGKYVNIAGRLRMLTQRMSKSYEAMKWGVAPSDAMAELLAVRKAFVDSLTVLVLYPNNTLGIRNELEFVEQQWNFFVDALLHRLGGAGTITYPDASVATASESILERLEILTSLYTKIA